MKIFLRIKESTQHGQEYLNIFIFFTNNQIISATLNLRNVNNWS